MIYQYMQIKNFQSTHKILHDSFFYDFQLVKFQWKEFKIKFF